MTPGTIRNGNHRHLDRRLELLFVCAHPAIDAGIRTPLMLQTVLGFEARQIARAFAVPDSMMAQRLVRAKRRIRDAGIPAPAVFGCVGTLHSRNGAAILCLSAGRQNHKIIRRTHSPWILMHGHVHKLFRTPIASAYDFKCRACPQSTSPPELQTHPEIVFVRKGHFALRANRCEIQVDTRSILLNNPGDVHVFRHGRRVRDECTILRVDPALLDDARSTFWRPDVPSFPDEGDRGEGLFPRLRIRSTTALDYLHGRVCTPNRTTPFATGRLRLDTAITDLVGIIFQRVYGVEDEAGAPPERLDDHHLASIERAKSFMFSNLQEDLSLADVAEHACMSSFHFSRLFRQTTSCSPYRYLVEIRLHHAAQLLRDTSLSVTEIAMESGFNGLAHFSDTFSRFFDASPTRYRRA